MLNCLSGKTSVFIKEFPCKSLCPCMPVRKYVMAYWECCCGNLPVWTWGKGRTYLSLRTSWLMPRTRRMHGLSLARLPALVACPTLPWAEVPGRFQQHMRTLMDWVSSASECFKQSCRQSGVFIAVTLMLGFKTAQRFWCLCLETVWQHFSRSVILCFEDKMYLVHVHHDKAIGTTSVLISVLKVSFKFHFFLVTFSSQVN